VFNSVSRHEGVWGTEAIHPYILSLFIRRAFKGVSTVPKLYTEDGAPYKLHIGQGPW